MSYFQLPNIQYLIEIETISPQILLVPNNLVIYQAIDETYSMILSQNINNVHHCLWREININNNNNNNNSSNDNNNDDDNNYNNNDNDDDNDDDHGDHEDHDW